MSIQGTRISRTERRGAILVCVLACLAVVSGLMFALTRSTLAARREAVYRLQVQQTDLLLDAGIQRAAQRLADSAEQDAADYDGETWQPTDAIKRFGAAQVVIKIDTDKEQRSVLVTASLGKLGSTAGDNTAAAFRTTRSHRFQLSTQ